MERQRTRATFLSSGALDCAVPSLSNAGVNTEDLVLGNKPYARWEVQVRPRWGQGGPLACRGLHGRPPCPR